MANMRVVCCFILVIILLIANGVAIAVEKRSEDKLLEARYSMVGLRLGFWADMSETDGIVDTTIDADLPNAGFYTELFIDYRVARPLFVELSFGIASRGDIVILNADDRYIGTLNLYPVLLQLKLAPLAGRMRSFQPFLIGGGGLVFGRQSIDIIDYGPDPYYNVDLLTRTETDFIGVFGGGIDLALSEQLGLNFTTKYHPVQFANSLAGARDYNGMSFSIGVSYFLNKK